MNMLHGIFFFHLHKLVEFHKMQEHHTLEVSMREERIKALKHKDADQLYKDIHTKFEARIKIVLINVKC